jgi:hypothetical protein
MLYLWHRHFRRAAVITIFQMEMVFSLHLRFGDGVFSPPAPQLTV